MFFTGNISSPNKVLYTENVNLTTPRQYLTSNQTEPTLLVAETNRMSPGATIVISALIKSGQDEPYYVSASYDQGSANKCSPGLPSLSKFHSFPKICDSGTIPFNSQDLIIATIISAISFIIALKYKKIHVNWKKHYDRINQLTGVDILLALPVIIISSVFILYICEEIPLSVLLASTVLLASNIISDGISGLTYTSSGMYHLNDGIAYSVIFVFISFVARSIIAFVIARVIINMFKSRPANGTTSNSGVLIKLDKYQETKLFYLSFAIMGLPLWSIVKLFFNSVFMVLDPSSLFAIIILIEVIRMSVLVFLLLNRLVKSDHFETKSLMLLRYVLAGVLATSGIFNLIVVLTILSANPNILGYHEGYHGILKLYRITCR